MFDSARNVLDGTSLYNGHATVAVDVDSDYKAKIMLPSPTHLNQSKPHRSQSLSGSINDSFACEANGISAMRRLSEREVVCWTLVAFLVFTVSWKATTGGYKCSLLLFTLLIAYVYHSRRWKTMKCVSLCHNIKENINHIIQKDRQSLALLLMYAATKVGVHLYHPKLEDSNGSPLSLILFTVYFIVIFIIPPAVHAAWRAANCAIINSCYRRSLTKESRCGGSITSIIKVILSWKASIILSVLMVTLSYVFDGDLAYVLRYISTGKSCWPLLVPKSQFDALPYTLKHAWFQQWHQIFSDYEPPSVIRELILFGREMEVIHMLPTLIGTFVLAQLLLPKENWIIKNILFGCISSVVLSGVISGALKLLLHRYRPNAYGNPYMWTGPSTATVNHMAFSKLDLSFPCGHTTVSMSVATCLFLGIMHNLKPCLLSLKFKIFLVVCLYFYPVVVLISRVSECYHWTSDATFGVSVYQIYKKK